MRDFRRDFFLYVSAAFLLSSCQEKMLDLALRNQDTVISGKFLELSAQALSCSSSQVFLHRLDTEGNRIFPPLDETVLSSDGSYSFDAKKLAIKFSNLAPAEPFAVYMAYCGTKVYSRIITGSKDQDISFGSSLLSYGLNTDEKQKIIGALKNSPKAVASVIEKLSGTTSLEAAYGILNTDTSVKSFFESTFNASPGILVSAAPEIVSISIPTQGSELTASSFVAVASHWMSTYQSHLTWKIDGTEIGLGSAVSWTPSSNSQGLRTVQLILGEDNGSGQLDTTKPAKTVAYNFNVQNNILPSTPAFSIISPTISGSTPVNTRNLTVQLVTGAGKNFCASFSRLAFSDNSLIPPDSSAFSIECSQNNTQDIIYSLSSAGDGEKLLRLWARDASGTISSPSEALSLNIDLAAPTITINSSPILTNTTSQSFGYVADDNGGAIHHYECSLDGGGFSTCLNPHTLSGLSAGSHTFKVRAFDTALNVSNEASHTWTVDLSGPVVSIDSTPATITNSFNAAFGFSATDTGGGAVARFECKLDSGSWSTCLSSVSFVVAAGAHQLQVRAVDTAGNISTAQSFSWTVDVTGPNISIGSLPTAPQKGGSSLNISFSVTEANITPAQSFVISWSDDNGTTWHSAGNISSSSGPLSAQVFNYSLTLPAVNSSQFKIKVTGTDSLGNSGIGQSGALIVDSTPPNISYFQLAGGATSVANPIVTVDYVATDASGISKMKFTEDSTGVSGSWVAANANLTFSLSQGGQMEKTVYAFAMDTAGNISSSVSSNISLDYGTPPTVALTSPTAIPGQNLSGTISLQWVCSSANGLAAQPVSLYYSPNADGTGLQPIAGNLTNNLTASTGSYSWAIPGGVFQFRILVRCKSAAGVVNQVLSGALNTTTWSIFAGDVGLPTEDVNAYNAILTPTSTLRYHSVADKNNDIYFYASGRMRKIDAKTGDVSIWAGNGNTACSYSTGTVLSTAIALRIDGIFGMASNGTSFFATLCGQHAIFKVDIPSKTVTKVVDLPLAPSGNAGIFLTKNKIAVVVSSKFVLYKVDVESASPTVTEIYGSDTTGACPNHPVGTLTLGQPMPFANPALSSCGQTASEPAVFADANADLIFVGVWTNIGSRGSFLENSAEGYRIKSNDTSMSPWSGCISAPGSNTKVYCAYRSGHASYRMYDLEDFSTETYSPTGMDPARLVLFASPSGQVYFMSAIDGLWLENGNSSSHLYGINSKDVGMGQAESVKLHLQSPAGITYDRMNDRIFIVTATDMKVIDAAGVSNITRTATNTNNAYPVRLNIAGTRGVSYRTNSGAGLGEISPILTGTVDTQIITQSGTVTGPFSDGTVATSGVKLTMDLTKRILAHSDGTTLFQDFTANNYILYKLSAGKLYRVAGLATTAPGHRPADDGAVATTALLSGIQSIQEIPTGSYAGDLLISDGTWLRRISYKSEATPRIYDVLDLSLKGFATSGLTDFYYDFVSETTGVLGTGNIYYSNGSVKKIKYDSTLLPANATVYTYPFEGTTLSGNVQLEVTPLGLLVLQPSKNRVLKTSL